MLPKLEDEITVTAYVYIGGNNLWVRTIKAALVLPLVVLLAVSSPHFINSKQ